MSKLIDATAAKTGTTILVEGDAYNVRSNDISKSGKHGASKCRIEAVGIFSSKKKILTVPGSHRFEVPMVNKRRGQVLSSGGNTASVMDLESFETIDIPYPESLEGELAAEKQVEYWEIEGKKSIMRVI
jgi:translation initiation factor 5A